MKRATQMVYGINGTGLLLLGIALLFASPGWISTKLGMQEAFPSLPEALFHIFQEVGCLLLFAALLCFWYIKNYDRRQPFHWAMTLFWFLMALLHTVETVRSGSPAIYAVVNGIPLIAYLATAPRHRP